MASWRWLLRPKWILALVLATGLLLYLLWPVRIYSRVASTRVLAMNHFGEAETGVRGLVSLRSSVHSNPRVLKRTLEKIDRFDREPVPGLGDEGFRSVPRYRKNQPGMPITFRRFNVIVRIVPDLPRRKLTEKEWDNWRVAVEEFARHIDEEIVMRKRPGDRFLHRPRVQYWYGDRVVSGWGKVRDQLGW